LTVGVSIIRISRDLSAATVWKDDAEKKEESCREETPGLLTSCEWYLSLPGLYSTYDVTPTHIDPKMLTAISGSVNIL